MGDPMLFERDPDRYLRARPPYPSEMWTLLETLGVARRGARVLDLGAGAGQVTGPLLARGALVEAVEPGGGLASLFISRFPNVPIEVSRAEEAELHAARYDGVVCGTALHWMDLAEVLPKVQVSLTPGGVFVPFWNAFFDPEAEVSAFRRFVNDMFGGPPTVTGTTLDRRHWSARLTEDGRFTVREIHEWGWTSIMNTMQLHDLVSTFNGWTEEQVTRAAKEVERLGGTVTEHYRTIAYVCEPQHG